MKPKDPCLTGADEIQRQLLRAQTRRHFLQTCSTGLGAFFLNAVAPKALSAGDHVAGLTFNRAPGQPLQALPPQFTARARRVIYLYMAGAPSQLELFDHKPVLTRFDGQDCP